VPLTGGTPTKLLGGQTGGPTYVAVDATNVYFTSSAGNVKKVPLDGGASTKLASSKSPFNVVANASDVFWFDPSGNSATVDTGDVMSVPIAGGTATTIASAQTPTGIAVDAQYVYWTNGGNGLANPGTLMKAPVGGGAPTTLSTRTTGAPVAIILDASTSTLYWAESSSSLGTVASQIMKMPVAGGTPTCIATTGLLVMGLALDGTSVYWSDESHGNVDKLTPK
jgi:hypothetical protein